MKFEILFQKRFARYFTLDFTLEIDNINWWKTRKFATMFVSFYLLFLF